MKQKSAKTAKQLPPEIERALREQKITETEPGPVVRDFNTLLDFIAAHNVAAGGKHNLLPMDALAELNARMTRPIEVRLKRPMQKSYPNLQGLYLMARASGLMRVERVKTGALLTLDGPAMASWTGLNPTEQYFALLEAWWLRATMEILGERSGLRAGLQTEVLLRWERIPAEGLKVDKEQAQSLPYWGLHNIALLDMFGLWRVEPGQPQEGKGWIIAELNRTGFGDALLHLMIQGFPFDYVLDIAFGKDEDRLRPGGITVFDRYRKLMLPYFPEWQNSLTLPPGDEYRDGVFTFKVSLGKVWRRIAIPANLTLADLNDEIQSAFRFDNDHLHCFIYKDRFGHVVRANHYYMDEPPYSDKVRIGETPLRPGEAMEYVFDFGDDWRFNIQLEAIDPPNPKIKKAKIIESHGKPPDQYRDW
jgi:hypothetical protein